MIRKAGKWLMLAFALFLLILSSMNVASSEDDTFDIAVSGPAVFDVRDITVLDSIIPDLMIRVVVENAGGVTADITVGWVLTRVDTGGVLDFGSDTFEVTAHTETTHSVSPTTSYVGSVNITFTGDGATVSECFPTVGPAVGDGGWYPPLVSPEARDTDGDGLTDKQEEVFGSNPLLPDTDFDGYTDHEEYIAGTDPTDASSYPRVEVVSIEILLLIVLCITVSSILLIFVYEKRKKRRTKA